MQDNQKTLKRVYKFEGKGLHTGAKVKMEIFPAEVNTGIRFKREDIGDNAIVDAIADRVTFTQRRTTLEQAEARVSTIEHLLATFLGLGIDNALVCLNAPEVPIMDGSAKPYTDAIMADGLLEQDVPRKYYKIKEEIRYRDEETGSELIILPDDKFSIELKIDYNSNVLGTQTAYYTEDTSFAEEVAPCRTFVFFHELEFLFKNGLIKGGDLENAIVILDNPVPQQELDRMAELFNVDKIERAPEGYLNNITLHFENECARHKLLDIMGDFSLIGFRIKGRIIANKSGHKINTAVAKLIREAALKEE